MNDDDGKMKIFDFLKQVPPEHRNVLYVCTCQTVVAIVFILLVRKLASFLPFLANGLICVVVGTFFFCSTFFMDEIVLHYFGYPGMFIAIFVNMVIHQRLNRRYCENMLILAKEFLRMEDSWVNTVMAIAQMTAAHYSRHFSLYLVGDDIKLVGEVEKMPSLYPHLTPNKHGFQPNIIIVIFIMEFLGGAVFHLIMKKYKEQIEVNSFFYAIFFIFSHAITGIFVGQPEIFLSRGYTCKGLSIGGLAIGFSAHVFAPVFGWLFVPWVTRNPSELKSIWRMKFEEEEEQKAAELERTRGQANRGGRGGNSNRGFRRNPRGRGR